MPDLVLDSIVKRYKGVAAVDHLSLRVREGELMCLLGPSGCGKTSSLRIIAGFETIEQGRVCLGEEDITTVPAQKRDIGIVFQSYALFSHLTVEQNVGFGLKMRHRPRREIADVVRDCLKLVQLDNVGDRLPRQLSGGQQQRVALARALAIRPRLLLLDEPLSNLDAKLRDEMRDEIRRVQRAVGITTIFVTHDQTEALAVADRLAVMDRGRLMQVGSPSDLYQRPANAFVASFIGQSNLLHGRVIETDGRMTRFETRGLSVVGRGAGLSPGDPAVGVVKTERARVLTARPLDAVNVFPCRIENHTYLGSIDRLTCTIGGENFVVARPNGADASVPEIGQAAYLSWDPDDCLVLPGG